MPRRFLYMYDADGVLLGTRIDREGNFADAFVLFIRAGDTQATTFDGQAVSFSRRFRQVVAATGQSVT